MKIQVAVFFGGRSVEHEVSVISAMQAIDALDKNRFDAIPVYITKDGTMYTGSEFSKVSSYKNIPALLASGRQISLARDGGKAVLSPVAKKMFGADKPVPIDVALPVVHGTFVEDGSLQGLFEVIGLPYCGCDVLSSALCMDKPTAKSLLRARGIPVLPEVTLETAEYFADKEKWLSHVETEFPYPVIVKPVNLGSSVGISKAEKKAKLEESLDLAFNFSPRVMIEPAVVNLREINVSVLGSRESARASVCEEPLGQGDILSYKDKYLSGQKSKSQGMSSAKRKIPAELSSEMEKEVQGIAVNAFRTLVCSGVVRIDFLLDTAAGKVYINEFNTIPGSLSFYLWEAAGLPFSKLLDELIDLAFARQRERSALSFTYETNLLAQADLNGSKGTKR